MSKRILVLCFIALLEATAHSQNKIALVVDTFLRNRENIISGEYTYRYMVKYLHDEEASEHKVKVRFYDLKRGPYFYTALIAENLLLIAHKFLIWRIHIHLGQN